MKIEELEKFNKKDILDAKMCAKIKRLLLSKHTPLRFDILQKYGIDKNKIHNGVQCPSCSFIPMQYRGRTWECAACYHHSKDAHLKAIQDYFLIYKPTITNTELREFLFLPSPRAATYLLSFLDFPSTGTNKGRVYHQPQSFPISSNHVFPPKNKH